LEKVESIEGLQTAFKKNRTEWQSLGSEKDVEADWIVPKGPPV
jgi:hypothetical protein